MRLPGRLITCAMPWVFAASLAASASTMFAQATNGRPATPRKVAVTEAPAITVPAGRSTVISTPWPVTDVELDNEKVADFKLLSPTQLSILGKAPGTTVIRVWQKPDRVWQASVEVQADHTAIHAELSKLFPKSKLSVRQSRDLLLVQGTLEDADQAAQLRKYLDATGVRYVDMTALPGIQQVQLKVTIAETSRSAVRALGINAISAGSDFFGGITIGSEGGGPLNPMSITPTGTTGKTVFPVASSMSPATTLFGGIPGADLEVFVQALAENQYLRVLAEPTLVALSGQEASFLAGGEFPVPVPQLGSGVNTITVEYKEFGVRLKFRPTVLGNGKIRLHVAPEVSELSSGPGSVQISGFTIPAILTRRAETTLELRSGQTFGMAGLINQHNEARSSRVPGLGDVPVLGALFRSVRYKAGDTELVVIVHASLVEPVSAGGTPVLPGAAHVPPVDWELYTMGQIEGKMPARLSSADALYLRHAGLNRLKGPGAWATYESAPAVNTAPPRNPATQEKRVSPATTSMRGPA